MPTLVEPIGRIARSHGKGLNKYEGKPAACLEQTAALGAGTPLGRGRTGSHAFAFRRRLWGPGRTVRSPGAAGCYGPNPMLAFGLARVGAAVRNRGTEGSTR